nr:transposase zinc-binding domain-containing protein [Draconibacterium orientale]
MVSKIPGPNYKEEVKYSLASFFERWWNTYVKSPNHYITPEQYKAVAAMRVCRTEALGGNASQIDHPRPI